MIVLVLRIVVEQYVTLKLDEGLNKPQILSIHSLPLNLQSPRKTQIMINKILDVTFQERNLMYSYVSFLSLRTAIFS